MILTVAGKPIDDVEGEALGPKVDVVSQGKGVVALRREMGAIRPKKEDIVHAVVETIRMRP